MAELKTLKEIREYGPGHQTLYSADELREEAIKWYKKLEEINNKVMEIAPYLKMHSNLAQMDFLKVFFDLTDEELNG